MKTSEVHQALSEINSVITTLYFSYHFYFNKKIKIVVKINKVKEETRQVADLRCLIFSQFRFLSQLQEQIMHIYRVTVGGWSVSVSEGSSKGLTI